MHWSQRVRHRFPDGQLFLNLRGFAAQPALEPLDALTHLLHALGVAATDIPRDEADASGLYRTLMAGRRMLVVLDDARDADQVRPLLTGAGACLTVITSRDPLTGLVASARPR